MTTILGDRMKNELEYLTYIEKLVEKNEDSQKEIENLKLSVSRLYLIVYIVIGILLLMIIGII